LDEIHLPPPVYHQWMYSQDPLPPDTRGRISSFNRKTIQAQDTCYLMDLYGQGSLESLAFQVDQVVVLEIMDGGAPQPEYPHDFPSWIRRADLGQEGSGALSSAFELSKTAQKPGYQVIMTKPVTFASRLIIRLKNTANKDVNIFNLYLEGTSRCI